MKCAAYGCVNHTGKSGLFCDKDWKRLPPELRKADIATARRAVAHLGKKDGYLIDEPPKKKVTLTDVAGGSEYV